MSHPSHIRNQKNNHPKPGSTITVDPIRTLEAIETIKNMLKSRPRDYLLFVMGINNALRAGDLLKLRAEQFKNARIDEKVPIVEQKTGKPQEIVVNKSVKEALDRYFEHYNGYNGYLFESQWPKNRPITVSRASIMVKKWCKDAGLQGNYGSHTLRKTFGYILRREYGISWEIIAKRYNHSSPAVTRAYLGVQDEEVNDIIMKYPI